MPSIIGEMSNLVYMYMRRNEMSFNLDFLKTGKLTKLCKLFTSPGSFTAFDTTIKLTSTSFQKLLCGWTAMMLQEPFRALFGRLLMAGHARPVPQQAARFMTNFANRARSEKRKKLQ